MAAQGSHREGAGPEQAHERDGFELSPKSDLAGRPVDHVLPGSSAGRVTGPGRVSGTPCGPVSSGAASAGRVAIGALRRVGRG